MSSEPRGMPTGRRTLLWSRDRAEDALDAQIKRGRALLAMLSKVDDWQEIEPERAKWDDLNVEILLQAFSDRSIAQEYTTVVRRPLTADSVDDEAMLRRVVEVGVTKLESVRDRLAYIPGPVEQSEPSAAHEQEAGDPKKVFVIYGRNRLACDAMCCFLRSLGLTPRRFDDVEGDLPHGTPYIGDVLEAGFDEARVAIVLLTGDEIVSLRAKYARREDKPDETGPTLQARPNVLFEAGMALAKHPKQTIIVELGEIRPFSDIAGRYVRRFQDNEDSRRKLADKLGQLGCHVEVEPTEDAWTAGDFASAIADTQMTDDELGQLGRAAGQQQEETDRLREQVAELERRLQSEGKQSELPVRSFTVTELDVDLWTDALRFHSAPSVGDTFVAAGSVDAPLLAADGSVQLPEGTRYRHLELFLEGVTQPSFPYEGIAGISLRTVDGRGNTSGEIYVQFDFNLRPPLVHLLASDEMPREVATRVLNQVAQRLRRLPGVREETT